ncbi:MAG: sigma-70 family RNA polymerase sigma factor [Oscillospiraceae bacterium]|nr:sigma-70 family RNA polymerase sigma factor [Oscillospiraceae bacterium]
MRLVKASSPAKGADVDDILVFCEAYRNKLINHCLLYFECEYADAEDIVQDAYLALYNSLKNGTEIKNYQSWLYAVALNHGNKEIRNKLKRNEYSFADNEEKDAALENTLTYEPDYVENMVTDEMIEERAAKIISTLNSDEKILYMLYYRKKKKLKEIAEKLGLSVDAVKKRHSRLKQKLEDKIKNFE